MSQELISLHPVGQLPEEDLRYDETFSQLKNQNAAVSPDAAWMLEKSFMLLRRSPDMRVCLYGMHASAILGLPTEFTDLLSFYAYILSHKFDESYPEGTKQKIGTFEWCLKSFIVDHMTMRQQNYSEAHRQSIQDSLSIIHGAIEQRSGEALRWHNLLSWLESNQKPNEPVQTPKKLVSEDNSHFECTREAKPFFDKFILALLKEESFERAIGLSRSYRWAGLVVPSDQNKKTNLNIRQAAIDKINHAYVNKDWKTLLIESEDLFLQPHGHFLIKLNFWSYQASRQLGLDSVRAVITMHIKKLYKSYGQLFSLMYNGGQMFCDAETLIWIEEIFQDENRPLNEPVQQDILQYIKKQDVTKMRTWADENPVKSIKDNFIHDLIRLHISKFEQKNLILAAASSALFQRSVDENLHAWEPELAQMIWTFHAGTLKEEKQHNTHNNNKTIWQAQWDQFTHTVAKIHLPAALEIMKYV